jgi:hypothetical protein
MKEDRKHAWSTYELLQRNIGGMHLQEPNSYKNGDTSLSHQKRKMHHSIKIISRCIQFSVDFFSTWHLGIPNLVGFQMDRNLITNLMLSLDLIGEQLGYNHNN